MNRVVETPSAGESQLWLGGEELSAGSAAAGGAAQVGGRVRLGGDDLSAGRAGGLSRILALPLLAVLWLYRRLVSPVLPPACRYYPSCSQYAEQAIRIHGPLLGAWLALRRLLRCHPFAEGGPDPVPPRGLKVSRTG